MAWANFLVFGLGGLLVSIPIVLHFMMQPKPKILQFPALRFVRERQLSSRSRMRLRHFLLLLLRCLLILVMAAALAGPSVASQSFGQWLTLGGIGVSGLIVAIATGAALFAARQRNNFLIGTLAVLLVGHIIFGGWSVVQLITTGSAQIIGKTQDPVAALIVFDTSPRMDYQGQDATNLEQAREIGIWLTEQFPVSSEVCVLATDGDQPYISIDVGSAKKRIETLSTTFKSSFIPETLNRGIKKIASSKLERKEIYVITDMTNRSWTGAESSDVLTLLDEQKERMGVFVIDTSVPEPKNISLGRLRLSSETVTGNGAVELATEISLLGAATAREIRMVIEKPDNSRPVLRDGQVLLPNEYFQETKTVNLRENSTTPISFRFVEPLPLGVHQGRVEIVGQDALTIDDIRHFTVSVRPQWEILVVVGDGVEHSNLTNLIAPEKQRSLGISPYNCTIIEQDRLTQANLKDYQAVFLLDPGPIAEAVWVDLHKHAEAGGGIAIFLGANAVGDFGPDPSFTTENAQAILTGKLVRRWDRRSLETPDLFISLDDVAHPVFEVFRGHDQDVPWYRFGILMHWEIQPDENAEKLPTQTVLRFGNGMPALLNLQIGRGQVFVMTTPITENLNKRDHNNKPTYWNELFGLDDWPTAALVFGMTQELVRSSSERLNLEIGELANLHNDLAVHADSYQVFTPTTTQRPTQIEPINERIIYRFTDTPGAYRLRGKRGGPVIRGFNVNLDPAETDLKHVEIDTIDSVLGAERYQLAQKKEEIQRQQGTSRRGQEFYPMLVLILIVILAVEQLMSNRFYSS